MRIPVLSCVIVITCLLLSGMAEPPGGVAGSTPALAVVVHKSSGFQTLSAGDLRRMLTGDLRVWPDKRQVVLIEQPETTEVQRRMLWKLLRLTPEGYHQLLLAVQFQGRELPLIKVLNSDETAIKFVWNLPGAISVVDASAAAASAERVTILRIDGKMPGEPGYLFP